jgi:glycosyltransferase involved in cell wall biosynthesis
MGGAEKQSLLLAKALNSHFNIHYIVQKKKPRLKQHLDYIENEGINYIQLSGNFISRFIQLVKYIKSRNIRLLIAMLTLDNAMASCVSLFTGIKCIGGVRSSYLPFLKFRVTWLAQRYILDHTVFNNYYGRALFLKKGFSETKSSVIHNSINDIKGAIIRQPRDIIKILSVGRFTFEKDYFTALRSIALLNKKLDGRQVEYIIIGDGGLKEKVHDWVKALKINNVRIIINPENLDIYYRDADIYLMSSISEGLPNTIMEAYNYSLPVVTTDVGDARYLVEDEVSGYLVPPGDFHLLSERLNYLIISYDKRITFGTHGHRHIIHAFSEDIFRSRYLDLINKVLN